MKQLNKSQFPISKELERFQNQVNQPVTKNVPQKFKNYREQNLKQVQIPSINQWNMIPINFDKRGIIPQDSINDGQQQQKVDLGENPFKSQQPNLMFRNFDKLLVPPEDDDLRLEIKVFPNSTKARLEQPKQMNNVQRKNFSSVKQQQIQEPLRNYQIVHQDKSQRTTPIKVDLDLQSKLFPDRTMRSTSSNQYNTNTVLVDTDKIKQGIYTTRNASPSFNDQIIQIKLHRNLDKHFYEFIKEYGIILQPNSPVSEKSTQAFGQSEVFSHNHSMDKNQSPNSDKYKGVFSEYFEQFQPNILKNNDQNQGNPQVSVKKYLYKQ